MEVVLLAVLAVVSLTPAALLVARRLGKRARERERYETWEQAAELLGGEPEQVGRRGVFRMKCRFAELDLELSHAMEPERTTVRCPYAVGVGPRFEAEPRGSLAMTQPGVPASLRFEPAEAALPIFNERRRIRVDAFEYPIELKSNGRELSLRWHGVMSTTLLRNAIELGADLASYWRDDLERLSELDGAERVAPSAVRVRRGQADVTLAVEGGGDVRFVASAPLRGKLEPFDVAVDDPALSDHLPTGVVEPELVERLGDARAEVADAALRVSWQRPPTDDAANAAIRLLDAVGHAAGQRGAFR